MINTSPHKTKVTKIFTKIAAKYDLMNDIISFGMHRFWKRLAVKLSAIERGHAILDLAGGSGDIALLAAAEYNHCSHVVLADLNAAMLAVAAKRIVDSNTANIQLVQADAEHLPFANAVFAVVFMAFGLRNVANKQLALHNIYRVLQDEGKLVILELSQPANALLRWLYLPLLFTVVPLLGLIGQRDPKSYWYLADSIYRHPKPATIAVMLADSGFRHCSYRNLCGGIVTIHIGVK